MEKEYARGRLKEEEEEEEESSGTGKENGDGRLA